MKSPLSATSRYLTKSRFKLGLECLTKLYYTAKKDVYADKNLDDAFLKALADGGFQVGELAKFHFSVDPVKDDITIFSLDHEVALEETERRLSKNENIVIAEAAFRFKNLFIRTDILVKKESTVFLYEVKAKSYDSKVDSFLNQKGDKIMAEWMPYLYDVAFQKYVLTEALAGSGLTVKSYLMLVDKNAIATVEGLNQKFKIIKQADRSKVKIQKDLRSTDLGQSILIAIPVDDVCDKIINDFPVPGQAENKLFREFVTECADLYERNEQRFVPIGSKCGSKRCQFYKDPSDGTELKSGFIECWRHQTKLTEAQLAEPLVLELWNGRAGARSFANELLGKNKFFLRDVTLEDIQPAKTKKEVIVGLNATERRMQQIDRVRNESKSSYIDVEGIRNEMKKWTFPLHMIDFETSMVALPFHKGSKPYEGLAFQFSHHTIDENWNVRHATQFICFEPGIYPNFDFIRALRNALSKDVGSVFRYHNHENSYLNLIYNQLKTDSSAPQDKTELMQFIQTITHSSKGNAEEWKGARDMIDLYELVLKYYYSPLAKGSNSLKQILPATIHDSDFLRKKYSTREVYGKNKKVRSLNFDDQIWINPEVHNDPYRTLPRVFDEYENGQLDALLEDVEEIKDGGAALIAYNYLQYSELPLDQRQKIKDALLRYCELDTMAMVMICEAWNEWCKI